MRQPLGFKDLGKLDHVCKLLKSIYGLHQLLQAWFKRLCDYLLAMEFKKSHFDQSLFLYIKENVTTYFLVYMDDIVLTSSSDAFIDTIIKI